MKGRTAGLLMVVAVLAALTWVALQVRPALKGRAETRDVLPQPDLTRTAAPQLRDFTETRQWFGHVESRNRTRVIALETGRISSIDAPDQMPITEGERLFTLGGPLLDSRLQTLDSRASALQERRALAEQLVKLKQEAVSQGFAKQEELAAAADALARLRVDTETVRQERQRLKQAMDICAPISGVFTGRRNRARNRARDTHLWLHSSFLPFNGAAWPWPASRPPRHCHP